MLSRFHHFDFQFGICSATHNGHPSTPSPKCRVVPIRRWNVLPYSPAVRTVPYNQTVFSWYFPGHFFIIFFHHFPFFCHFFSSSDQNNGKRIRSPKYVGLHLTSYRKSKIGTAACQRSRSYFSEHFIAAQTFVLLRSLCVSDTNAAKKSRRKPENAMVVHLMSL